MLLPRLFTSASICFVAVRSAAGVLYGINEQVDRPGCLPSAGLPCLSPCVMNHVRRYFFLTVVPGCRSVVHRSEKEKVRLY